MGIFNQNSSPKVVIHVEFFKVSFKEHFLAVMFALPSITKSPKIKCHLEDFHAKIGLYKVVFVVQKVQLCLKDFLMTTKAREIH